MSKLKRLFCDCETSGLDNKKHAVLQIAGIVEINGKVEEEFNLRAAPIDGDSCSAQALEVNGLTMEQIQAFPPAEGAYATFCSILEKYVNKFDRSDKLSFLAYNASFDADFIRQWFKKLNDNYFGSWFFNPPIDVMVLAAHHLEPERHKMPNFKLATVAEYLGIEFSEGDLHDALFDVKLCREIYLRLSSKP
ncbi:MAG: 3'-5' exonuclease [Candidatus Glassbacteria bacterium]|nr:3'-5' exonuclease [Candidatus Glassbacteria bacterium]